MPFLLVSLTNTASAVFLKNLNLGIDAYKSVKDFCHPEPMAKGFGLIPRESLPPPATENNRIKRSSIS
jgi:hypothetical protein